MDRVRINGLDLSYRRAGEGSPLVLVHGAADDSRVWTPQLDDLSDEFTVIAWDEPGAGQSADVPDEFQLTDYADSLAGLICELDLGPVHLAGLSWGGTVVLELYRRHPELFRTLILADTYAGWKGSLPADDVLSRVVGVRAMLADPPQVFDPTLPGLFAAGPPARFMPLLRDVSADVRPHSMRVALEIMAAADLSRVLPTVAVRTLLIWGQLDARSPLTVAREFERQIPGAQLSVIPGCGHVSNLDAPDQFTSLVRKFCRDNDGAVSHGCDVV
ncbi:alpha/beta fold hydrolase [Microlunatus sp. GCM10028923]|uniref:alpha/beta fold hydrolase n=1 Tax=Microlunatus sp. GCM10028923 TaxID=3273400 RepID=UPI00361E48A8